MITLVLYIDTPKGLHGNQPINEKDAQTIADKITKVLQSADEEPTGFNVVSAIGK